MKTKMMLSFIFLSWVSIASAQQAQMPQGMGQQMPADMHQMPGMENTGVVDGELFIADASGKKTPVPGQNVTMIVFNNGQQVLMLNKVSDEKGQFHFKNIFKDPSYAYGFGTMYEENLYVFPRFSLGEKENSKKIDFQIGTNSPLKRDMSTMGAGMPGKPAGAPNAGPMSGGMQKAEMQSEHSPANSGWNNPSKSLTIFLCVLVVVIAAYYAGKSRNNNG